MELKSFIGLFAFIYFANCNCPGFRILGYKDVLYQQKDGYQFCGVVCDEGNNFHPTEIHPDYNNTVNYIGIYHYDRQKLKWLSVFSNSTLDLNCQMGCPASIPLGSPNFFSPLSTSVNWHSPVSFFRAVVECQPGYFPGDIRDENDLNAQPMKMTLDCHRDSSAAPGEWRWSPGVTHTLRCYRGCVRFGTAIPAHQDAFGAKTSCKHLGAEAASGRDLVSACESVCDLENGYYAIGDTFLDLVCGEGGGFSGAALGFLCEQGCKADGEARGAFAARGLRLLCRTPFFGEWHGVCEVECADGYVATVRGRMAHKDFTFCRRGVFSLRAVVLRCARSCGSWPDSCEVPGERCIGENEEGSRFCSVEGIKYHKTET